MALKTTLPVIVHGPKGPAHIAAGQPLTGLSDSQIAALKKMGAAAEAASAAPAADAPAKNTAAEKR